MSINSGVSPVQTHHYLTNYYGIKQPPHQSTPFYCIKKVKEGYKLKLKRRRRIH